MADKSLITQASTFQILPLLFPMKKKQKIQAQNVS